MSGLRDGRRGPPTLGDSSPGNFLSRRTSQSPQEGFLGDGFEGEGKTESEKVGRGGQVTAFVIILLGAQGAPSLPAKRTAHVPTSTLLAHENESNAINSTRNHPHSAQGDK